ncbi:MAG: DUF749 domain-containing protein [Methanobacteriaceae archaeon]|nr:DUF749 domain-containing protein [Methanobacteriaceae archaeon]
MFVASLVGIFRYTELPEKFGPFVQYKASIEKKNIKNDDDIAILNISGTESYHVLFLSSYQNIKEIEAELKEAHAEINFSTKKILEGHL